MDPVIDLDNRVFMMTVIAFNSCYVLNLLQMSQILLFIVIDFWSRGPTHPLLEARNGNSYHRILFISFILIIWKLSILMHGLKANTQLFLQNLSPIHYIYHYDKFWINQPISKSLPEIDSPKPLTCKSKHTAVIDLQ